MNEPDLKHLEEAVRLLENPTWIARITDIAGMPIEWAIARLPKGAGEIIKRTTEKAITKALGMAVLTMDRRYRGRSFKWPHRLAVLATGGVGGFFGLPGLAVELPVSTMIMLRSIADIARAEGEDIGKIDTRLACIEVFALGDPTGKDAASETGYYAVRVALSRALAEAGDYIAEKGLVSHSAPAIVRLIGRIASRFGVIVSEKAAVEAIPIVGAVAGAAINLLFINHFQSMARGHFIIRGLERKWGESEVKTEYDRIANKAR